MRSVSAEIYHQGQLFNSLWLSDAWILINIYVYNGLLPHVSMHYMNSWWLIISNVLWHNHLTVLSEEMKYQLLKRVWELTHLKFQHPIIFIKKIIWIVCQNGSHFVQGRWVNGRGLWLPIVAEISGNFNDILAIGCAIVQPFELPYLFWWNSWGECMPFCKHGYAMSSQVS